MYMLIVLTTSVHQPNLRILDNEAPPSLKQGFLNNNIKYQLVPLHIHKQNAEKVPFKHSRQILSHISAQPIPNIHKNSGIIYYRKQL